VTTSGTTTFDLDIREAIEEAYERAMGTDTVAFWLILC